MTTERAAWWREDEGRERRKEDDRDKTGRSLRDKRRIRMMIAQGTALPTSFNYFSIFNLGFPGITILLSVTFPVTRLRLRRRP